MTKHPPGLLSYPHSSKNRTKIERLLVFLFFNMLQKIIFCFNNLPKLNTSPQAQALQTKRKPYL